MGGHIHSTKDLHIPLAMALRKKCLDDKLKALLRMGCIVPPARYPAHSSDLLSKQQDYGQSPEWSLCGPEAQMVHLSSPISGTCQHSASSYPSAQRISSSLLPIHPHASHGITLQG